jgi:hypothetical protein
MEDKMKKIYLSLVLLICGSVLIAQPAEAPASGDGSSEGTAYQIASLANLRWLSENPDMWDSGIYFIQTADIDASATQSWNEATGFSPIGNNDTRFLGNYMGNGHTVSGLYINRASSNSQGLFGSIGSGAELNGLGLIDANISGQECIVGGLTGSNSGTVSNCYASGSVSGTGHNIGGLIGWNDGGSVSNCYANVAVTGTGTGDDIWDIGGLIGWNDHGSVSNCYASGSVTGTGDIIWDIGGLIGNNSGTVSNCYVSGSVSGTAYDIGGLIGFNDFGSNVSTCYVSGSVTGTADDIGGFVGFYHGGTITACFWDSTVNSGLDGAGDGYSGDQIFGKTTTQMKTLETFTAVSWDFKGIGEEGIWNIGNSRNEGYPYLDWQYPEDTPLPITLANFTARYEAGRIILCWQTASETENLAFRIYRDGEMIAELEGAGTTTEPQDYTYTDQYVIPGRTYTYVLADVDLQGKETKHPELKVETKVEGVDLDYTIGNAYPNPFNPQTVVPLNLAIAAEVKAVLYDTAGRRVRDIYSGQMHAGSHDLKIDGADLSTGIYLLQVRMNDALHVQKIALMK